MNLFSDCLQNGRKFRGVIGSCLLGLLLLGSGQAGAESGAPSAARVEQAARDYSQTIGEEFEYRKAVESEAAKWAQDLMYYYVWGAQNPTRGIPRTKEEFDSRVNAELAWLTIAGQGFIATYDFVHAETTLLGSKSHFVSALLQSPTFWREVKKQCEALNAIQPTPKCAERLKREIELTQLATSNASFFVGGGVVVGLGKRVFNRYMKNWVVSRVLPALPAFARTKWAMAGVTAAVVIVPAGFVVAALNDERKANKEFIDDLERSLKENQEQASRTSVMRMRELETEREVLVLGNWVRDTLPTNPTAEQSELFVQNFKLSAPFGYELRGRLEEIEALRGEFDLELGKIPDVTNRLRSLAKAEKTSGAQGLSAEDAELLRKARYLAALRLVTKALRLITPN